MVSEVAKRRFTDLRAFNERVSQRLEALERERRPIVVSVTWDNLSGKPASFAPATHSHIASEVPALADLTGWGAYVHTGASQTLVANTKVDLVNNAGSIIHVQKPSDIATFYDGDVITGREGDSIGVGVEFIFTPSSALASFIWVAIDIGGGIGEIYPRRIDVTSGNGVAHEIVYQAMAYTLNTWAANGGTLRVFSDGPGVITGMRYVIHRLHKAN